MGKRKPKKALGSPQLLGPEQFPQEFDRLLKASRQWEHAAIRLGHDPESEIRECVRVFERMGEVYQKSVIGPVTESTPERIVFCMVAAAGKQAADELLAIYSQAADKAQVARIIQWTAKLTCRVMQVEGFAREGGVEGRFAKVLSGSAEGGRKKSLPAEIRQFAKSQLRNELAAHGQKQRAAKNTAKLLAKKFPGQKTYTWGTLRDWIYKGEV